MAAGAVWLPPAVSQTTSARHMVMGRAGSYLGVGAIDIDEERAKALNLKETRGVEIKSVDADSPAAKAGLKEGDVVLDYNGMPVAGIEQFSRLVRETPSGRQVHLNVWRGGSSQTLNATIATRPNGYAVHSDDGSFSFTMPPIPPIPPIDVPQGTLSWRSSTLGIESESLTPQLAEFFGVKEGVLVRAVTRNSPAEKAGLKAGDVITKVDDRKISNSRDITSALRSVARDKHTFPLTVVRKQQETTLSVTLEERRGMRWYAPLRNSPVRRETQYC
jgi:serine protease Do